LLPVLPPPLPPKLPPKPPASASREERAAHSKAVAESKKAAELAVLQAEVDGDLAKFKARGVDASRRLALLHVPLDPMLPVSSADAFGAPRHWGGLRDLLLDTKAKLAICPIEKVASSELKKLLLRMMGDARWRDEPWFKGGIHKVGGSALRTLVVFVVFDAPPSPPRPPIPLGGLNSLDPLRFCSKNPLVLFLFALFCSVS
jgi:hypothetical protein